MINNYELFNKLDPSIYMSNPVCLNQATRGDHMKDVQTPYLTLEWLKGRIEEGTGLSKDQVEDMLKVLTEEGFKIVED